MLVHARDCNYQRILWCSPDNNVVAYRLLTLTYGTACAPYLPNKVIKQLTHDECKLSEDCPSRKHERAIEFPLAEDAQLKVLGLFWDPESDSFHFKVTPPSVETSTKWIVLSFIAKLYDTMGWLNPVMLVAKLLMQELWLRKLDWVEKLPNDLQIHWSDYHNILEKLESLKVPRFPHAKWRYISTKDNPADYATRGLSPEKIMSYPLWWQGPPCLKLHSTKWPDHRFNSPKPSDLEPRVQECHHVLSEIKSPFDLMFQFSSWSKLLRVTAYCKRFVDAFAFKHSKCPKSKPQSLTPSLRERLQHAPISFDEKHPIILPQHHLSKMLAVRAHIRSLHGGLQLTLNTLRQSFWILRACPLVKGLIKDCFECARERATLSQQLMENLPHFRVTPNRPFTHTGADYTGPFHVRFTHGRDNKSYKTYVAHFVSCCARAVHLELVSNCTSATFLAAFQRVSSRRGRPAHLYSDNGTTFHGADKELRSFILKLRLDSNLHNEFASEGTSWHFIPPSAPHFGGLWKANFKSFKQHLKRIVGAHTLTYKEFSTLQTRIGMYLNFRPIVPLSNDPEDFAYLTPGHFLIGAPLTSIPEPSKRYKWFNKTLNLMIGDIVLIKHDSLPPCHWFLGRITECYKEKDDLIRSVRVKLHVLNMIDRLLISASYL
ncbi:uncharacterized protein LOC117171014 [Belonocnema kinseyi]|uniref:uncharacterized protein LOC117171014 n=1 Tax=Belonocnema kinseyi TaxID=2817044 RepID=UPI00143D3755|nr:uncharacterized protein LOC117171014 [Belonocnema kinseyi]